MVDARGDRLRLGVQSFEDRGSIHCCVVEAGWESSAANEFGGPGSLLDGDCWKCGSWVATRRRSTCGTSSRGRAMTMEQVVTQLQQELLTLRAQISSRVQMAEAVRAIDNLAAAQVRKDTPNLIDVNGLCRPKEFSGKEEDF